MSEPTCQYDVEDKLPDGQDIRLPAPVVKLGIRLGHLANQSSGVVRFEGLIINGRLILITSNDKAEDLGAWP